MKHDFAKNIKITFLLAILILSAFLICSCSSEYKEYHIEDNVMDSEKIDDHEFSAYFFLLPEGNAVIEITCTSCCDGDVIQTIDFPAQSDYYASLDFEYAFDNAVFQDMNFDGTPDLYVPCSVTTENLEGMAWLWDGKEEAFILSEELSALYELTVFPEDKLITSQDYSSPDEILCKEFKWEKGKLVQVGEYTVTY